MTTRPAKLARGLDRCLSRLTELQLSDLHCGLIGEGHEIGKPKLVFPKILVEDV